MPISDISIKPCTPNSLADWLAMRAALWPHCSDVEHRREMAALLEQPGRHAQFLAYDGLGTPAGFLEVSLRYDHVNGTRSSPVAFIEGIFTQVRMRRKGVAKLLLQAAENWAKEKGCTEMASDAQLENAVSHNTLRAFGFEETERVVYFCKPI